MNRIARVHSLNGRQATPQEQHDRRAEQSERQRDPNISTESAGYKLNLADRS